MSKKIKCGILAFSLAAVVASTAAMSACTIKTKHPRAEITVNFNNVDYQIEYTLYRNMYPQTVQHFIELADSEFYNNMIIHDYRASDWFTGSYKYDASSGEGYISSATNNALGEYLENNSKEADYYALAGNGTLTPTVFKQVTYDKNNKPQVVAADALPTLIGEFSQNDHNIDKGALTARTGSLKMFYYSKGESNQKAAIKNSFGQIMEHDYAYNCATSVFSMQVSSGSSFTAAQSAKYYMQRMTGKNIVLLYSNNVLRYEVLNNPRAVAVAISQSGNSVAAIEAVKKLRGDGYPTIALTQDMSSDVAKNAEGRIDISCGEESCGPKTKGYSATVLLLMLLSLEYALREGRIGEESMRQS